MYIYTTYVYSALDAQVKAFRTDPELIASALLVIQYVVCYSLSQHDSLYTGVQSWTKHEETQSEDQDIDDAVGDHLWAGPESSSVEVVVCDRPEDETVEGIEGSRPA